MIFRKFLNLYHERQARKRLAQIEAQTLSGNAAALARHGAEQRKRAAKAKRDEMTERLRMEIRAGHVAKMRWPQNG